MRNKDSVLFFLSSRPSFSSPSRSIFYIIYCFPSVSQRKINQTIKTKASSPSSDQKSHLFVGDDIYQQSSQTNSKQSKQMF